MARGKIKREDVLDMIRAAGKEGVTIHELSELFEVSGKNISQHVLHLKKDGFVLTNVTTGGRRGGKISTCWTADQLPATTAIEAGELSEEPANVRIDDPAPEPSKHKPNQNHEGYNDPTATEAIKRMDRNGGFMPGGIYKTTAGEQFLVLMTYPDTILGYRVDYVPKATDTDSEVAWKVGANSALVHTHRVCSVPFRKLILSSMTKCPFESFRDILRKSPFNACKKIEVPVEDTELQEKYDALVKRVEELDFDKAAEYDNLVDERNKYLRLLSDADEAMHKLDEELSSVKASNRHFQIMLEKEQANNRQIGDAWCELAAELEAEGNSVEEVCAIAKKFKDLSEAPIDPKDFGVDRTDYAVVRAERDVYKSIVDKVVSYWTA